MRSASCKPTNGSTLRAATNPDSSPKSGSRRGFWNSRSSSFVDVPGPTTGSDGDRALSILKAVTAAPSRSRRLRRDPPRHNRVAAAPPAPASPTDSPRAQASGVLPRRIVQARDRPRTYWISEPFWSPLTSSLPPMPAGAARMHSHIKSSVTALVLRRRSEGPRMLHRARIASRGRARPRGRR